MGNNGYRTCDSTGCHVTTPQETQAWQSNVACDAWDKPGRITAVDGQSRSDYDKMIKDNFRFTQDNYGDAYKEAARQGKPVVAIFGSFENNNSKSLIQGTLARSGALKDAVYIYVDPTKCKDADLKKFAQSQLSGGHNATMSIVFSVKPGQDGKPEPEAYTYRWQGDHPSMVPSFRQAISEAQERMNGYKGQFKTEKEPPAAPKPDHGKTDGRRPRDVRPPQSDVRPPQTDVRPPQSDVKPPPVDNRSRYDQVHPPKPNDQVNPRRPTDQVQPDRTQKQPAPQPDLYKYDGSGKKPGTPDLNDGNGRKPQPDQAAEQERRHQAAEQERRNQVADQERRSQADRASRQSHDDLDQRHRDSLKWNSIKEQEQTRLAGSMTEARNKYPEIDDAKQRMSSTIRFNLLDSAKAHAMMNDARSGWSSTDTNHNAMANVAERQRMNQWRQLVSEATAAGPTSPIQRQEQMALYQGLTGAGKPFSGSDFALDGDGRLQNHGAMWTARCADTLANTCKPGQDRKLASTLVPAALLDNNVPEADKLRLLDGVKNLTIKDQNGSGTAPLTREQEIVILTQALKVDREKQFGTRYAEALAPTHLPSKDHPTEYKDVTQYLKHDKDDQIAFQTAVMKRLADLKAVEAVDAMNVIKDHPTQAPLARAAEEQLTRITPSVTEMRQNIISNPLLAPADRSRYFDADANADPRPDRRAAAVVRSFAGQHFSDASDPGLARMTRLIDDGQESTTVRLAAASVLSDAQLPGARDKATKFAADLFCAKAPIQQYKDDAGEILNRLVPINQAKEVVLSDGRVVVLYHGQDGKIAYADRGQKR